MAALSHVRSLANFSSRGLVGCGCTCFQRCFSQRKITLDYEVHCHPDTNAQLSPIVVSHALYGCKGDWSTIGKELNYMTKRKVVCYDAVNHGLSNSHEEMSYRDMTLDLVILLEKLNLQTVSCIGHRMGGKTLMTLALTQPERVEQVVIIDIAPSSEVILENTTSDLQKLASLQLYKFQCKEDLEAYLREQQMDLRLMRSILFSIIERNETLNLSVNLENVAKNYSDVLDFPPFQPNVTFGGPSLFITGFQSLERFLNDFPWVYKRFPAAKIQYLPELNRWLHLERPDKLLDVFAEFFLQANHKNDIKEMSITG